MKKNLAMRLASGLMLSCLLTSCVISGTFAKYTTSATATDTARVAKWGVTVTGTGLDAFANTYGTTVKSDVKVVAPGTEGNLAGVKISGTPEVAVKVSYAADLTLNGWTVDSAVYCPIVITVGTTEYKCTGTLAEFETTVENAIAAVSKDYEAGTDLSTVSNGQSISWAWAFEGNDDKKDTALGNAAADGNGPTISLTVTTTVTQKE